MSSEPAPPACAPPAGLQKAHDTPDATCKEQLLHCLSIDQLRPGKHINGADVVNSRTQKMLRLVGRRSFTQHVGTILGKEDIWRDEIRSSKILRDAALAHVLQYRLHGASPAEAEKVERQGTQLLEPIGIQLLHDLAMELGKESGAGQHGLQACWAW